MEPNQTKILVVEDDADINRLLVHILNKEGYETDSAYSGSEALLRTGMETYQLILLDLMLPGVSGESVLKEIRKTSNVPVIVLSAKTALSDRVELLRQGADDYITKPFEKEEVLARVEVQLRRQVMETEEEADEYKVRELLLERKQRRVFFYGEEVNLTVSEFDILELLMSEPDKIFSKAQIYQEIWHGTYLGEDNTISVHVSNIRAKLAKIRKEDYIKTVWGIGFKMIL